MGKLKDLRLIFKTASEGIFDTVEAKIFCCVNELWINGRE